MLVQDRDAQYYEPPLVQTEGPNAKKKKKKQEHSIRLRPNLGKNGKNLIRRESMTDRRGSLRKYR